VDLSSLTVLVSVWSIAARALSAARTRAEIVAGPLGGGDSVLADPMTRLCFGERFQMILRESGTPVQALDGLGVLSRRPCQKALLFPGQRNLVGLARTQHSC
jgi:hypothetical protein